MTKINLADLVKKAELSAYYESSELDVGKIVRDVRTGIESTKRIEFPEWDVHLHMYFKKPVNVDAFVRHAARYLKNTIPGVRRLVPVGVDSAGHSYELAGRKYCALRINTLAQCHDGGTEFAICCNYVDAITVLRMYALGELGIKPNDLKEDAYLGNSMRRLKIKTKKN